ncbi:unnamed protein product [Cylindrotheca closterium]|uniref:Uncharacterized protein n=1 Tax=Cylindrotheca closterium TaxID=2856 RepID=A0AAD2PVE4_9STRA|nr:unnamed protein product [Cylindrotheca closterium]
MITRYHRSSGAKETSDAASPRYTSSPQYAFDDEPAPAPRDHQKKKKSIRSLANKKSQPSPSSALSASGVDAGQSAAGSTDSSSGGGLTDIMQFLNDLEEQENQDKKQKKLERKMSGDRSTLSAASSLAYSEGLSTLCYSEGSATLNTSDGGGTLDGSHLAGAKLLGSLLGEPPSPPQSTSGSKVLDSLLGEPFSPKSTSGESMDASTLVGGKLLDSSVQGEEAKASSKVVGYKSNRDEYYYNTVVAPIPLSTNDKSTIPSLDKKYNSQLVSSNQKGNDTVVPLNSATSYTRSRSHNSQTSNRSSGSAAVPWNASTSYVSRPNRTSSFTSNTTSNTSNSASTPVPSDPSPTPLASVAAIQEPPKLGLASSYTEGSTESHKAATEESKSRRKKKSSRKSAAQAVDRDEESYFSRTSGQDTSQASYSQLLCGLDLANGSKSLREFFGF